MFVISGKYKIGGDFEVSARNAIREQFDRNGYPPNAVLAIPGTTSLQSIAVGLGTPAEVINIPVRAEAGNDIAYGLARDEFALDICDPNETNE